MTCFGESCGYNDEVSFCFEVESDVDEQVECTTPDYACCAGGSSWTFPAARTEPKCGTLTFTDTSITCTTASGHSDTMERYDGNACF